MNEESVAILEISQGDGSTTPRPAKSRPIRGITKIIFGICCYTVFAAVYFLKPNKPVLSFGQLRYTVDALLEVVLTVLSLPGFFLVYRYGAVTFEENLEFTVPEFGIELLLVTSMIWIALSNGIHITSKLSEQIIANSDGHSGMASSRSIHYLRQAVGHVAQHVGWQMLFAALMLGQLKRPYRGSTTQLSKYTPYWGIVFGLLFTQGTIAAGCMTLGFALTVISIALFSYLAYRSRLPSHEIPVLRFFMSCQLTFLFGMILYWSAFPR